MFGQARGEVQLALREGQRFGGRGSVQKPAEGGNDQRDSLKWHHSQWVGRRSPYLRDKNSAPLIMPHSKSS